MHHHAPDVSPNFGGYGNYKNQMGYQSGPQMKGSTMSYKKGELILMNKRNG